MFNKYSGGDLTRKGQTWELDSINSNEIQISSVIIFFMIFTSLILLAYYKIIFSPGLPSSAQQGIKSSLNLDNSLNSILISNMNSNADKKNDKKHEIFFSYAWGEEREKIVDQLYDSLEKDNEYSLLRDKKEIGYKGLISDFMNRIGEGNVIIVVISDKYLRSEYCMSELYEIFRNSKLSKEEMQKKIFPIYVENIDLGKADAHKEYGSYWRKEVNKWIEVKNNRGEDFSESQSLKLARFTKINRELGEFLDLLSDMNALTKDILSTKNFEIIKNAIKAEIEGTA